MWVTPWSSRIISTRASPSTDHRLSNRRPSIGTARVYRAGALIRVNALFVGADAQPCQASRRRPTIPRRRPNRAEKREANRTRILAAAREIFGRHGYQGATIEEIADQAGLSNGAIYYNFASKQELFLSLLEERIEQRVDRLTALPSFADDADLRREARDVVETLKGSRTWRLLLLEFVAYTARNRAAAPALRSKRRDFRDALTATLERRARTLEVEPALPPERLALLITALVNGLAFEELAEPGIVPTDLLADALPLLLAPP